MYDGERFVLPILNSSDCYDLQSQYLTDTEGSKYTSQDWGLHYRKPLPRKHSIDYNRLQYSHPGGTTLITGILSVGLFGERHRERQRKRERERGTETDRERKRQREIKRQSER